MLKTYINKRRFVEHELLYLTQRISGEIANITYEIENDVSEIVTIYFQGRFERQVNVTGDSLRFLAIEVLNRI